MFSERIFQFTFLASLIIHGAILFQNPSPLSSSLHKKEYKLEVTYVKAPEKPLSPDKPSESKEVFLKIAPKINAAKEAPPPFIDRESIFKKTAKIISAGSAFAKPIFAKTDIIAIKKKITLPALETDKINNPSYMSYYQLVREKIRRCAYQNYMRTETGEAYISFIIANNGSLSEARFVPEKSSFNPYLKEIALRSVRDAAPFPGFPQELDYPQLSFNVVISFEVE